MCVYIPALVHLRSEYYAYLKKKFGQSSAQNIIRPLTSHNGKLGFNFDLGTRRYDATGKK